MDREERKLTIKDLAEALVRGDADQTALSDERRLQRAVRTIRYYIAEGLLPKPDGRGRPTHYRDEHVLRLRLIRLLSQRGMALNEIKTQLNLLSLDDLRRLTDDEERQANQVLRARVETPGADYVQARLQTSAARVHRRRDAAQEASPATPRDDGWHEDAQAALPATPREDPVEEALVGSSTDWDAAALLQGLQAAYHQAKPQDVAPDNAARLDEPSLPLEEPQDLGKRAFDRRVFPSSPVQPSAQPPAHDDHPVFPSAAASLYNPASPLPPAPAPEPKDGGALHRLRQTFRHRDASPTRAPLARSPRVGGPPPEQERGLEAERVAAPDTWQRYEIVPGVEIHVRKETAAKFGTMIEDIVAGVRSLLSHR